MDADAVRGGFEILPGRPLDSFDPAATYEAPAAPRRPGPVARTTAGRSA